MNNQKNENEDFTKNTGHAAGIQGSASNYEDNVIMRAARGHGFAAEKANHMYDKISGKDAHIIGGDNAKNGADRFVDGIYIQTKYCSSGSKCVSEAFDQDIYRYFDNAGKPMQLEVPSDMYDAAVQAMEERINKGQIPGVNDPKVAKEIIRKGHFTYEQARNIAKAGTVEGLVYDSVNGIKLAGTAMGLTALLSFAIGVWQGRSKADALDAACFEGICVGGIAWVSSIMTAQIGRTSVEGTLRSGTDWVVKQMSPRLQAALANAFRDGSNIYGAAAANHVSKLLRGNIATTIIITTVLSVDDFIALFSREISGKQAFKNICKTASGAAGGSAGMWAGAAYGTATLGPGLGTVLGGVGGAVVGGFGASTLAGKGLNACIEDDSVGIEDLMNRTFGQLAHDYLLSQNETDTAISAFRVLDMENTVRAIHASGNRAEYTRKLMLPFIEREVVNRPPVFLPSQKKLAATTSRLVERFEEIMPS